MLYQVLSIVLHIVNLSITCIYTISIWARLDKGNLSDFYGCFQIFFVALTGLKLCPPASVSWALCMSHHAQLWCQFHENWFYCSPL